MRGYLAYLASNGALTPELAFCIGVKMLRVEYKQNNLILSSFLSKAMHSPEAEKGENLQHNNVIALNLLHEISIRKLDKKGEDAIEWTFYFENEITKRVMATYWGKVIDEACAYVNVNKE